MKIIATIAEQTGFVSSKMLHIGFSINPFYISLRNLSNALTINALQFIVSEHQSDQSCASVQAEFWYPLQVVVGKIEMFELTERLETKILYIKYSVTILNIQYRLYNTEAQI